MTAKNNKVNKEKINGSNNKQNQRPTRPSENSIPACRAEGRGATFTSQAKTKSKAHNKKNQKSG